MTSALFVHRYRITSDWLKTVGLACLVLWFLNVRGEIKNTESKASQAQDWLPYWCFKVARLQIMNRVWLWDGAEALQTERIDINGMLANSPTLRSRLISQVSSGYNVIPVFIDHSACRTWVGAKLNMVVPFLWRRVNWPQWCLGHVQPAELTCRV